MRKQQRRRGVRWAPLLVVGAVALVTALTHIPHLGTGELDFDEGVYWLSLRSLRAGNHIYSQVYSSQPPVFLLTLGPPWSALGGTIEAGRTLMTAYDVIAIAAAAVVGWRLVSPWAGVALAVVIAVDPRMTGQSVILQADGPSIAIALCALAAAVVATTGRGRRAPLAWAALAGALLVASVLTKVLGIGAVPAVVATLLLDRRRLQLGVAALTGGLVVAAVVLLPLAGVWPALWQQAVGLHLSTRNIYPTPTGLTWALLGTEWSTEWPVASAAAVGAVCGWWGHRRLWRTGLLWCAGGALALLATAPTYPHHSVVMTPGLACLAVSGLLAVVRAGRSALREPAHHGAAIAGVAIAAVLAVAVLATALGNLRPNPTDPERVAAIDAFVPPSALVLTDDQFELAAAGRDSPPEWVDTSLVRFFGSDVTAAEVEASVNADPRVCAVLIESNHLNRVPGLVEWAAVAFPEHHQLDGGAELDVRPGCPA